MNITKLIWDSEFFGLRIGRAEILTKEDGEMLASQRDSLCEQYDLLYIFANHNFVFRAAGAKLVDEKVVYEIEPPFNGVFDQSITIWNEKQGVTDELLHLALESGVYSRFKTDEDLPVGSYERLYSRWIEQSVKRNIATEVFCYMKGSAPIGLITLNNKNEEGVIGLVAVHEDYINLGIGSEMMQHVFKYAGEYQIHRIVVATQLKNIPGCRFYEKNGFVVESITDVWHWWL